MIDRCPGSDLLESGLLARAVSALALLALGIQLSGCANIGDSFASAAFVDPAKYDMMDCKQLEAERKSLAARTAELRGLIEKAKTGSGGTVVSELAYGNDYISVRASTKLVEENWERSKCVASAVVVTPAEPAAPAVGARKRASVAR